MNCHVPPGGTRKFVPFAMPGLFGSAAAVTGLMIRSSAEPRPWSAADAGFWTNPPLSPPSETLTGVPPAATDEVSPGSGVTGSVAIAISPAEDDAQVHRADLPEERVRRVGDRRPLERLHVVHAQRAVGGVPRLAGRAEGEAGVRPDAHAAEAVDAGRRRRRVPPDAARGLPGGRASGREDRGELQERVVDDLRERRHHVGAVAAAAVVVRRPE